ncbi:S-layer homology domain-containing protein [Lysinibacillus sp. SGAir0095]|uniref:S-layer homology domain-containing protein n=1 Tax=Lysinibacillus sp. SGAir0095 TaxID=2070463 RepID=UPI0010CCE993|nr:S-layer homology domain-containing protein [Lysinibacillus sp. SGAir0095]QCR31876.1 hypothetical protein C1N55_06650 [Lysinibacillus sp. SGAir0095]
MNKKTSKKLFNTALATAMVAGSVVAIAPTATEAAAGTFKDLNTSNSHYNTVMNLVERGLVKGYPDNTFKPGQSVNRAHAALILANVLKLDTVNVTDPKFKDVPKGHPYYGAIAALANAGIIKGFEDGTYGMTKTLTRGQMAVIIKNAFDLEAGDATTPFKDIAKNPYKEHITALFANGVTTGTTPTTFGAASNVTRGQFATFVVKAEAANAVEKVVDIKDGQIITNKGTYAIEGDLAKVFNASNAAALKGAKVNFKFAGQTAALASLEAVAAEATAKRILGVASLNLVAGNATFDAGGYSIPEVTVSGNNVQVKNMVADKLTIADNLTVNLTGVEAKEVTVSATTKLTLDATSKIEKLAIPEGKDIKDVITNYDQVKDQIKEVVKVDESGSETPVEPGTPAPGLPGPGPSTPSATELAIDAAIKNLVTSENNSKIEEFGSITFSESTNTITFTIKSGSGTKTIADVRTALKTQTEGVDYSDLVKGLSNEQIDTLLTITSTTVTAGTHTKEFMRSNYFDYSTLDINREAVVEDVDLFIDEAIRKSGKSVVDLNQFGQVFDEKITINVAGIRYTVDIVGYTPAN